MRTRDNHPFKTERNPIETTPHKLPRSQKEGLNTHTNPQNMHHNSSNIDNIKLPIPQLDHHRKPNTRVREKTLQSKHLITIKERGKNLFRM
jgi:hypothetical protein